MKKKIVVFGASGDTGRYFIEYLIYILKLGQTFPGNVMFKVRFKRMS